jgi:hypothetical protein
MHEPENGQVFGQWTGTGQQCLEDPICYRGRHRLRDQPVQCGATRPAWIVAKTAATPIQSFPWFAAADSLRKKSSWFPPGSLDTCRTRYLSVRLIHRWPLGHFLCMPSPYRRHCSRQPL